MRFGPCLEARATGEVVDPGESIFDVIGVWTPADTAAGTAGQAEFLKLAGSQGWVPHLGSLQGLLKL